MDFCFSIHSPHIVLLCSSINCRIVDQPLAETDLARNPLLLSNQIYLRFSCQYLKGIMATLGFSYSNFLQIFECPKAAVFFFFFFKSTLQFYRVEFWHM